MNNVLGQADITAKMREISLFPAPRSLPDSTVFLKSEVERWAAVIKKVGIESQ